MVVLEVKIRVIVEDIGLHISSFEAEPPASRSEGFRLVGSKTRVGRGGSRHSRTQTLYDDHLTPKV